MFLQKKLGQIIFAISLKSNIIKNKIQFSFVIPATTRSFIDNLVDYYISEAGSYKQMAMTYAEEVVDIPAATFGLIVGSIYSAFLQYYDSQRQKPPLEDIQEFTQIIKRKAAQTKRGILDAKT